MGRQGFGPSIIKNIYQIGFKVAWIWLLNLKVINEKFSPIKIYTTQPTNREETKHFNLEYEEEENQQHGEMLAIEKLFNIAITLDMPHNLIATQMEGPTNIIILIIILEDPLMQEEGETQSLPSLTQRVMSFHNLLLLLHFSIRQIKAKEPLEITTCPMWSLLKNT